MRQSCDLTMRLQVGDSRPRYLTPAEVQEILRRMWARNGPILSLLFAADKNPSVRSRSHCCLQLTCSVEFSAAFYK